MNDGDEEYTFRGLAYDDSDRRLDVVEVNLDVPNDVILQNLYVRTVFGRELFDGILADYGKEGWNAYSRRLALRSLTGMSSTPEPKTDDDLCMPVRVEVDLVGESFRGLDLSGLDLVIPDMDHCDFEDADLRGCCFGGVLYASFRNAHLGGVDFSCADVTGADFTGAEIDGASFIRARHLHSDPPVGLPRNRLSLCQTYPANWRTPSGQTDEEPRRSFLVKEVELRSFWGRLK